MQDSIHKYKYLKYKAKYLKLVYGGAVLDVKNAQKFKQIEPYNN